MGWSSTLRRILLPPINLVRQVPLLALAILFVFWFGGKEHGVYIYVAYGTFVMVVISTVNAIRNVPPIYAQFAQTLGADRATIFRTVIFPASVPELVGGVRIAIGLAWAITVGAEYLAAQGGLGRMIELAEFFQLTGRMILGAFVILACAYVLNKLVERAEKRLLRWHYRA